MRRELCTVIADAQNEVVHWRACDAETALLRAITEEVPMRVADAVDRLANVACNASAWVARWRAAHGVLMEQAGDLPDLVDPLLSA